MVLKVISIHILIFIVSSIIVYYVGYDNFKRKDKYAVYTWSIFALFVLMLVIWLTYHCCDMIVYYNEQILWNN